MLVGANKAQYKPSFMNPLENKQTNKQERIKPCCFFKAHANMKFLHFSADFKCYSPPKSVCNLPDTL